MAHNDTDPRLSDLGGQDAQAGRVPHDPALGHQTAGVGDANLAAYLEELRVILAETLPFSDLPSTTRDDLVAAADIQRHLPGDTVLDGFSDPSSDVYVVLTGKVGLWHEVESRGLPDDTQGRGAFFGFSAMLTGRSVGPRAAAMTYATVARIPGPVADTAFVTSAGARFLTDHLLSFADRARATPGFATVGALIDQEPTVVPADTPLREVGEALTRRRQPGVVVRLDGGSLGLITDGSVRRHLLVNGVPVDGRADQALADGVPHVQVGDSAGEVLIRILDATTSAAIVTDRGGNLAGVVGLREFALTPTSADVALHEQLRLAASADELVQRARQRPEVLSALLQRGLATDKVIQVNASLTDVVVRRAVQLCLERRPNLSPEGFTWLALGSNGRREAVLSSDIESAVIFPDGTSDADIEGYREAFAEVDHLLARAGLAGDSHGVSAHQRILSRTASQWLEAARGWLADPRQDTGAVMISLLVDSRAVIGESGQDAAGLLATSLPDHPATMRDLLHDALSIRAHLRTWDMPWRRSGTVDVKHDALLPLVNLARWVGLAARSTHRTTPDRLRAGARTALLTESQGEVLAEAFEVLQRVRLRYQLLQWRGGHEPSNVVDAGVVSPIDRTILTEAVREISQAQRRLANLAAYSDTDDWGLANRP